MSQLDQKLRQVIENGYANAPALHARFNAAGLTPDDIQGVADLPKLPILPKDRVAVMQQADPPFGGMLAVPFSEISHIYFSPGPIYEPGPEPDDTAWDVAVACLQKIGFQKGDIVLNSFSYHLVPAGMLFDAALRRLGCIVVPGGVGNSDLQLKMMGDLRVTGYAGTPSFLMTMIRKAEANGLDFTQSFNLKKVIFSAEPLAPSLRQEFVDKYGLAVGNAYGTAEMGMLALNTGEGMAMQLMDRPIVEVVAPDTGQPVGPGETGEVVVTNLSMTYPLIRLGTGDMAMNVDPNPGQSQQSERAIILVGRSGDAVKVRGMFVHPNQLRFAAGQIPGVAGIQGVVTRPDLKDVFTLRVAGEGLGDEVKEMLKTAVTNLCRVRVDDVEFVAAIPEDAPGMVDGRTWE